MTSLDEHRNRNTLAEMRRLLHRVDQMIETADKQKVKVMLSMFGRSTSTELDFDKVEKA